MVIAEADDTDDEVNNPVGHRRSLSVVQLPPCPVLRNPSNPPRESIASLSRSSEVGGSQGEC